MRTAAKTENWNRQLGELLGGLNTSVQGGAGRLNLTNRFNFSLLGEMSVVECRYRK